MKSLNTLLIVGSLISQISFASGNEIRIGVNGMVCGFCAQGITKKFKAEPAIDKVDVKLSDKAVILTTKDSQDISDERIKEILTNSGYNVEKIERK